MQDIEQILKKVTKEVEVVHDGKIHYLVLNQEGENDFTMNYDVIFKIHECLDEIEKTTGDSMMVTLSTQKKKFMTGFDMGYWLAEKGNSFKALS